MSATTCPTCEAIATLLIIEPAWCPAAAERVAAAGRVWLNTPHRPDCERAPIRLYPLDHASAADTARGRTYVVRA